MRFLEYPQNVTLSSHPCYPVVNGDTIEVCAWPKPLVSGVLCHLSKGSTTIILANHCPGYLRNRSRVRPSHLIRTPCRLADVNMRICPIVGNHKDSSENHTVGHCWTNDGSTDIVCVVGDIPMCGGDSWQSNPQMVWSFYSDSDHC